MPLASWLRFPKPKIPKGVAPAKYLDEPGGKTGGKDARADVGGQLALPLPDAERGTWDIHLSTAISPRLLMSYFNRTPLREHRALLQLPH